MMSRLASQSPDSSQRGVIVEKPKANIYTVLLLLSLIAISVGCICLWLEMKEYNLEIRAR